jgi:DNA-binding phage protein
MNLLKIKVLAETRAGGLRKLANDIGMSEANLHRCIKSNNMQAICLEKIALIFNVPMGYFFDELPAQNSSGVGHIVSGNGSSVRGNITLSQCQQEVETLRERLKDKEEIIVLLKKQLKENKQ